MRKEQMLIPVGLKNPYYISSPPYTRKSAGVRALHLLARALNMRGYPAYIAGPSTNPIFQTELLDQSTVQAHYDHGLTPVMIYPEVLWGNPHEAPIVVRYLLNYPGVLGGPETFAETDMLISYGRGMGKNSEREIDNLYIPVCDMGIYHPPQPDAVRSGSCFYAGKFREVYHQETYEITNGMTEITRSGPNVMAPVEIAELFRKSEFFYCYENSSLSLEARLCGCPVILIPNPFFQEVIASDEIGLEGVAWGTDPQQIKWATETVGTVIEKYRAGEAEFWQNLDAFIEKTQRAARACKYKKKIVFNAGEAGMGELEIYRTKTSHPQRLAIALVYLLRDYGIGGFFRLLFRTRWSVQTIKRLLRKGECSYISQSHFPMTEASAAAD